MGTDVEVLMVSENEKIRMDDKLEKELREGQGLEVFLRMLKNYVDNFRGVTMVFPPGVRWKNGRFLKSLKI